MTATPEGSRKTARKLMGDNPTYYIELGRKGGQVSNERLKGDSEWGKRMAEKKRLKRLDNVTAID